jgi:DNA-binding Lrp family transcriptional regulator
VIIDPIDLKLIRQLELEGSIAINEITNKFHITEEEILLRIKNFEDLGFINSYGVKLFLPKITGGKWFYALVAVESTPKFKPEKSIPYLEEIVENITYPRGVCPDMSLLLYTEDLDDTYKKIYRVPGVKYAEIYKVGEYNVTVPQVLLKNDWKNIAKLFVMSKLNYMKINEILIKPKSETEVKLSSLIWSKKNRKGIISVFPNFNWSIIKNYTHLHLAVTTKMRTKDLRKIISKIGYSANITSRFKKKYLQVEFDIWGFNDLQKIISPLQDIPKLTIDGSSFAYRNIICKEWIKDYINEKI